MKLNTITVHKNKHNIIEHCNDHINYRLLLNAIDSYNYDELQKLSTFVNKNKIDIYEYLIEKNDFQLFKFIYENDYEFDLDSDYFYLALEKKDFSVYILSRISKDIIFTDFEKNQMMNTVIYHNNYSALIKLHYGNNLPNEINTILFTFILDNRQYITLLFLFCYGYLRYNMYSFIIKTILIKLFILNLMIFICQLYYFSIKRYIDSKTFLYNSIDIENNF
jgi:hypothetical protein